MHIYRKTQLHPRGSGRRLMMFACCYSMVASGGGAQNLSTPGKTHDVTAGPVTAGPVAPASLVEFHSLVTNEASLLGYWPLAQNLDAVKGCLILQSGKKKPVFRPGFQGYDSSADLSNGGYLSILPAKVLDSPELTIELVCKIKHLAVWHSVGEGSQLPFEYVPKVLDEIEGFLAVVPKPVSRKNLDGIYLFDQLTIEGDGMGAMAYEKSIYLCCIRPVFDIRCSLYHELSHILQVAYPVDDKAWTKLLPKDFKYGAKPDLDAFGFDDKLRADGFIINYSTENRHEDIAVLSDYVFVRKEETKDLMEAYPALKRKVTALVKYYQAISPDYDFSFYDTLLRGKKALSSQAATHQ